MKSLLVSFVVAASVVVMAPSAFAHCEVPCGIYDDHARVHQIEEHITTIEKAMNQIEELSSKSPANHNQIVRWVTNKESHAEALQEIVFQYFMTQRIKPVDAGNTGAHDGYNKSLRLLHGMLVEAMKSKQTLDHQHIDNLRSLVSEFEAHYFAE